MVDKTSPPRKRPLTVGVMGGMGPEATVDFMSRILRLTPAVCDQDHVPMLVDNNPQVPDRQAAMRSGDDRGVRAALASMAARLAAAGAHFLVMPCNTAHAFVADARATVSIPFLSIIDTTIETLQSDVPSARAVGLLATDACLSAAVYQTALRNAGIELKLPDAALQADLMSLIFRVKGGDTGPTVRADMAAAANALVVAGADAVIAGCTEIPLVLSAEALDVPLISSTETLAARTVALATGVDALPAG